MIQTKELDNGNKIFFDERAVINEKNYVFGKTHNNILFLDGKVDISKSKIEFGGNNSVVFLGSNIFRYKMNLKIHNNPAFHVGKDNYINHPMGDAMKILVSEEMNVFIGNNCFTSFGIWIRTNDGHMICSMDTYERLNPARGVFIGDHVWIGQNVTLLKGTQIGSGSIVGASAVVSGKRIPSNTAWAGIPARQLKDRVFWTGHNMSKWTSREKQKYQKVVTTDFSYEHDESGISFDEIDRQLSARTTADGKLEYLLELSKNQSKNRFAV